VSELFIFVSIPCLFFALVILFIIVEYTSSSARKDCLTAHLLEFVIDLIQSKDWFKLSFESDLRDQKCLTVEYR